MKNNFIKLTLLLILYFGLNHKAFTDEFIFNVTQIEIYEDGNLIKGLKGGKVTTKDNVEITADNFEYNKLTSLLRAQGDVKLIDSNENITIESNVIYYLKNKELIYTNGKSTANNGSNIQVDAEDYFKYNKLTTLLEAKGDVIINDKEKKTTLKANEVYYLSSEEKFDTIGETEVFIENEYEIVTSDLAYLRIPAILSSEKKTTVNNLLTYNFYELDDFEYSITEEILKGNKVINTTNYKKPGTEKYFFNYGFFDLKNQKFLGKDVDIIFDNMMYGEEENDPRLKGVYGSGDEFNTYVHKGTFTTCKKTDKCPPWLIESDRVRHDKIKKRIIYKDAWLKLYDVPVVYLPKFFHPDPTVERQSGFLRPRLINHTILGSAMYTPYFLAISENQDMTIKPRLYDDGKFIIQSEYRVKTPKTLTIADFSYGAGYRSRASSSNKNDTKTHLFTKTNIELEWEDFNESSLELRYENVSRDNYLKMFELTSPLLDDSLTTLETRANLVLEHELYDFGASIAQYETLSGYGNSRFQYTLPSYSFSRQFYHDKLDGAFSFSSGGNNTLKNTNEVTTNITNDLNYRTPDLFTDIGLKSDWGFYAKNLNSLGKNSTTYKNSPQAEAMTGVMFSASFPLVKSDPEVSLSTIEPRLSLRYSPHQMKNHSGGSSRINVSNVHSFSRLGIGDSYEEGESLTLGISYKTETYLREYHPNIKKISSDEDIIQEIDQYFDIQLATVFRAEEEENIPLKSTLNRKTSNLFGEINYSYQDFIKINYDFSIDNDLSTFEYNSIDSTFEYKNWTTTVSFLEENGTLGENNFLGYKHTYNMNDANTFSFNTRRNRKLNLTEYHELIYQYKNDCLTAGVQFKKKYYSDGDLLPTEELFFTITIVPLGTFSPAPLVPRSIFNEDFRKTF
jgi:LPS-assembly protein